MKKFLLILFLITAFSASAYAENINGYDFAVTPADLSDENFFRSPMSNSLIDPEVRNKTYDYSGVDESAESSGISSMHPLKEGEMPFFKQVRVYLTNKTRKENNEKTDDYAGGWRDGAHGVGKRRRTDLDSRE